MSKAQSDTLQVGQDGPCIKADPWALRIRIGVIVFAVVWLFLIGSTWTRADDQARRLPGRESDDDVGTANENAGEYSFKWLDPDKKIYVLQNRRYIKANRALLSLMTGPGFSNPYRNTWSLTPRLSYYFSESWGFEVFFDKVFNSENNTYKSLVSTNTQVFPIIRTISSETGALLHWVPWYAKINVFNSILYFDWYFAGGLGSVASQVTTGNSKASLSDFTTQNELGYFLSTGHLYHLSDTFTVRLDILGTYYRAPLNGQTGDSVWFSNYDFTFGFGVRL